MKKTLVLITGMLLFALLAFPAQAQSPAGEDAPVDDWKGRVTGVVENQTEGGTVPAELVVMLHAWDMNFEEKLMRDAPLAPDGSFVFEDVPFSTELTYGVMTTYNDVLYFAEPVQVAEGQTEFSVVTPIYESTSDPAHVEVSRAHIILNPTGQGLQVTEVLSVSNFGDRTVVDAVPLADGQSAALAFTLPAGASPPSFRDGSDRWQLTDTGFADTAPLQPGENSAQIVAFYQMDYDDGMTFDFTADYPTQGLTLVIPEGRGVEIAGEGLLDAGVRSASDGSPLHMFTSEGAPAGKRISFSLVGEPAAAPAAVPQTNTTMSEPFQTPNANRLILISVLILAIALIGLGVALLRRNQIPVPEADAEEAPELDEIFRQIALLDDARQRGEVDAETYHARRQDLMEQGRRLLAPSDLPVADAAARA